MKKVNNIFALTILLVAIWHLPSCVPDKLTDLELETREAGYAIPLFSTSFNIGELMTNTLNDTSDSDTLLVAADGSMTLFYSGDVAQKKALEIFAFLDKFGGTAPIFLEDTIYYVPYDTSANSPLAKVDIRRADLKRGQITTLGQNTFNQAVSGTLHIPQLTRNGVPFKQTFGAFANNFILSATTDISDYILTSTNDSLFFRYEAYLADGTRVKFPSDKIGALLQDLEFSYLEGYWGNETYPLTLDTIAIDINQTNFSGGNIRIKDPRVTINVFNSFGFPTRGFIKVLKFEGSDGVFRTLESSLITDNYIDFAYPQFSLGQVGQTKATSFTFDKSNSNIDDIFNSQPVSLVYEVVGIANAEEDPSITGFMTDSSIVRLNVRVELPLEGRVTEFGAESEFAIDFSDFTGNEFENIDSVIFKMVTENDIPVSISGQFLFLDEQNQVLGQMFDSPETIMSAADVGPTGLPLAPKEKVTFIPMDKTRFEQLKSAKKIKLQASFTTSAGGTQDVKILYDQLAKVRMGVVVKTKIN